MTFKHLQISDACFYFFSLHQVKSGESGTDRSDVRHDKGDSITTSLLFHLLFWKFKEEKEGA